MTGAAAVSADAFSPRLGAGDLRKVDQRASSSASDLRVSEEKRIDAAELITQARAMQDAGDAGSAEELLSLAWGLLEEAVSLCPRNQRARFYMVSLALNDGLFERARDEALAIYNDLSEAQIRAMNDVGLHLSLAHASKMLEVV